MNDKNTDTTNSQSNSGGTDDAGADGASIDDISTSSASTTTAPAITIGDLTAAVPAPSAEADTHVLVPNDHVSLLHRLADDIERGIEGAEALFMSAFRHVFPKDAA
jgi:hypothetical protein